jgi:hypothetical protein
MAGQALAAMLRREAQGATQDRLEALDLAAQAPVERQANPEPAVPLARRAPQGPEAPAVRLERLGLAAPVERPALQGPEAPAARPARLELAAPAAEVRELAARPEAVAPVARQVPAPTRTPPSSAKSRRLADWPDTISRDCPRAGAVMTSVPPAL